MSDTSHHVLIAYAAIQTPACQSVLERLSLPHLEHLLGCLTPATGAACISTSTSTSTVAADSDYALPHEYALAHALGLERIATPWAAWHSGVHDSPCAYITPCHWQAGADQVLMHPPEVLGLDAADSQAFLAVLAPWFAQDGITLSYQEPLRWLAQGSVFADIRTASLERVQGRDVRHWMPQGAPLSQRLLQRLHCEVQMLLYDHPLNEQRTARGLPPVNAFWMHGAGQLSPAATAATAAATHAHLLLDLRAPALREDWSAWAKAWLALDAGPLAQLAQHAAQGHALRLTLCGEHSSRAWHSAPRSWGQRIQGMVQHLFRPQRFMDVRQQL